MIKSFAHKGLERFYKSGSMAGIQAMHAKRLRLILALLEQASAISDVNAPGLRLHSLQGNMQEYWSVTVQSNWRLTFRFENGDVYVINYVDYH